MSKKHNTSLGRIESLTLFVLETYLSSTHTLLRPEAEIFFRDLRHKFQSEGASETIKYVKETRIAVLRYLTGEPLTQAHSKIKLHQGWPIWILGMRIVLPESRIITPGERDHIRYVLTLLSCLRGIMVKPTVDVSTITSPTQAILRWINPLVLREVMKMLGQHTYAPVDTSWTRFHFTTKAGPLGQALLSSVKELTAVLYSYRREIETIGGGRLANWLSTLEKFGPRGSINSSLGKISYFSDKEGKTRIVAIVDYWTQTTLKPIHSILMNRLRRLPCDCTFDQGKFRLLSKLPGPFYSMDLSAATDRMPLWLQRDIMSFIIGDEKASCWARLLTHREYLLDGKPIKYSVGQPMGAYSSWASMAFTHHFIVQWAAYLCGHRKMFKQYVILGDDVVIASTAVAIEYKRLLFALDMPYSVAKTHVSKDSYEFAKRWVICRQEVTPFSIGGLDSTWKRYSLLYGFLRNQATHGWVHSGEQQEWDMVLSLMKLKGRPAQAGRILKLYKVFHYFQSLKGMNPSELGINVTFYEDFLDVFEFVGIDLPKLRSFYSPSLLLRWVGELAKIEVVERDLRKFQSELPGILEKVHSWSAANFSSGVSPAVTSLWLPAINCLAALYDQSIRGFEFPDELLAKGLSKFFIGRGVFSMESDRSTLLAESAIVKRSIKLLEQKSKEERPTAFVDYSPVIRRLIVELIIVQTEESELAPCSSFHAGSLEPVDHLEKFRWPTEILEDRRRSFLEESARPVEETTGIDRVAMDQDSSHESAFLHSLRWRELLATGQYHVSSLMPEGTNGLADL